MTKTIKGNVKKIAMCSDIHFGGRSNDEQHNQDNIRYLSWFAEYVKSNPDIDAVGFLGDWNENRNALNVSTLNYSYQGAKILNDLGIPVFFIVGNHDLYHRHTREVTSVVPFNEFSNFVVIDQPTIIKNETGDDMLFCPYMFHEEYPDLVKYCDIPVWFGHFEFQGFVITGYNVRMESGPTIDTFEKPKQIFSGHFHKRQAHENVVYIGNTFPTNFGDAGDDARGLAVYDFEKEEVTFEDWDDCPKFRKTTLSALTDPDNPVDLPNQARVKCVIDIPITYQESQELRSLFIDTFNLREFAMEESREISAALTENNTAVEWDEDTKLKGVNELVVEMLNGIDSEHFQKQVLIDLYRDLKI